MPLKPVHPVERHIELINRQMRDLAKIREELLAQLPERKTRKAKGWITDPRTGERVVYGKQVGFNRRPPGGPSRQQDNAVKGGSP